MKGHIAVAKAMSGIAGTMLRRGRTFHRRFGASKLKLNSRETKIICEAKLIMIDEISMMNWKLMNMFERFLQQGMVCNKHMCGKCVVVMGIACSVQQ